MKLIPLTKGYFAKVNDEDYDRLAQFRWKVLVQKRKNGGVRVYAARTVYPTNAMQQMHRIVMGITDPKVHIDHRDNDGLNNQRENLRIANKSQNQANCSKHGVGTSQYKGVHWNTKRRRWVAQICINYKNKFLGYFDSEKLAAKAYDAAAANLFGDFARTSKERLMHNGECAARLQNLLDALREESNPPITANGKAVTIFLYDRDLEAINKAITALHHQPNPQPTALQCWNCDAIIDDIDHAVCPMCGSSNLRPVSEIGRKA